MMEARRRAKMKEAAVTATTAVLVTSALLTSLIHGGMDGFLG